LALKSIAVWKLPVRSRCVGLVILNELRFQAGDTVLEKMSATFRDPELEEKNRVLPYC
jgi:hypothetical protein